MKLSERIYLAKKISTISIYFTFSLTISLLILWNVYFIRTCWNIYKQYKLCQRTPVLHPLYSDVQYLSKQRKLYNLKTHIIKNVIMIVCSSIEIAGIISALLSSSIISNLPVTPNITNIQIGNLHCVSQGWFLTYVEYPFIASIQNISPLLFTLLLTLISILSCYLTARYLNHPFKRTLINYIIWCHVQGLIIALCSTLYTWLLMVLVFPLMGFINWVLLVRDTSLLSRVLRSNLTEIRLHSNNRILYLHQLSAYKFYRVFRIVLLLSTFLIVLAISGYFIGRLFKILLFNSCKIELDHNVIIPLFLQINDSYLIKYVILLVEEFAYLVYLNLTFLPLCLITITPVIVRCVKRCREKEGEYRYSYEKLEPLIRKYL